jgi:hypothetical protein
MQRWMQRGLGSMWSLAMSMSSSDSVEKSRLRWASEPTTVLMAATESGMDILRTGIGSIDPFDAKTFEYRIGWERSHSMFDCVISNVEPALPSHQTNQIRCHI